MLVGSKCISLEKKGDMKESTNKKVLKTTYRNIIHNICYTYRYKQ